MASIKIATENSIKTCKVWPGELIMDVLRRNGYSVSAPCGGNGTCKKCKVRLEKDGLSTSVLACQTVAEDGSTVHLEEMTETVPQSELDEVIAGAKKANSEDPIAEPITVGAAVDLGTTTVAVALYDLETKETLGSISRWNKQMSYGADVISRIENSKGDGLAKESEIIRAQVSDMIEELKGDRNIEIKKIFIAGNTVMQHIYAGISPVSIGLTPFEPETYFDSDEVYSFTDAKLDSKGLQANKAALLFAPCVSGYVGGDITAGILSQGLHKREGKALFIDAGTNGEMVLGDMNGMVACSVASGPAFEGAGLSTGMPAKAGAVCKVWLTESGLEYDVIGGGEAKGICGSGILDLVACLLELGYIDESGVLEADDEIDGESAFKLTGEVYITHRDVRQIQLAKAAIATGIKILMEASAIEFDDLDALYLAGGFGNYLDKNSAVKIGMLPKEMLEKIVPCGNTSLKGASKALLDADAFIELKKIKNNCRYIELSTEAKFNDYFVGEMYFPEV